MGNSNSTRGRTYTADTEASGASILQGNGPTSTTTTTTKDEKQPPRRRRRFFSTTPKPTQPYVFGTLQLNTPGDVLHRPPPLRRHPLILPRHVQVSAKCLDGLVDQPPIRRKLHKLLAAQGRACRQLTIQHRTSNNNGHHHHHPIVITPRRVFRQDLEVLLEAVLVKKKKKKKKKKKTSKKNTGAVVEHLEFGHVNLQPLPTPAAEPTGSSSSSLFQNQLRQLHRLQSLQFRESRLEASVLQDVVQVLRDTANAWPHLSKVGLDVSLDSDDDTLVDAVEEALVHRLQEGHLTHLSLSFCPRSTAPLFWQAAAGGRLTLLRLVVSSQAELEMVRTLLLQTSPGGLEALQLLVRPTTSRSSSSSSSSITDDTVVPPITLLPLVQGLKSNTTLQSLEITLLPSPQPQQQQQPRNRQSNINSYRKISLRFHQNMAQDMVPLLQLDNYTLTKVSLEGCGCMEVPLQDDPSVDLDWTRAVPFWTKLNRQGRARVLRQQQQQQQQQPGHGTNNTNWKTTVLEASLEESPMALSCLYYWLREQPEKMEEWKQW